MLEGLRSVTHRKCSTTFFNLELSAVRWTTIDDGLRFPKRRNCILSHYNASDRAALFHERNNRVECHNSRVLQIVQELPPHFCSLGKKVRGTFRRKTQETNADGRPLPARFGSYESKQHCRELYQTPMAA